MKTNDQIIAILGKGMAITQADIEEIEFLLTQLDLDDFSTAQAMAFEAISLIVNDPLYEGDAEPI